MPQTGTLSGRYRELDYENLGSECGRDRYVNVEKYWIPGTSESDLDSGFAWREFKDSELAWTLNRPDVYALLRKSFLTVHCVILVAHEHCRSFSFPKFFTEVSEKRLSSIGKPHIQTDILTIKPIDVIHALLPHLTISSYLALTSTCRLWRRLALTTFQPHARKLVLSLGWAVPLRQEYAISIKSQANSKTAGSVLAHEKHSPQDADWLLYLSHVHRTGSMRARRWKWVLAKKLARLFEEKRKDALFVDGNEEAGMRSVKGRELDDNIAQMWPLACMLRDVEETL